MFGLAADGNDWIAAGEARGWQNRARERAGLLPLHSSGRVCGGQAAAGRRRARVDSVCAAGGEGTQPGVAALRGWDDCVDCGEIEYFVFLQKSLGLLVIDGTRKEIALGKIAAEALEVAHLFQGFRPLADEVHSK